MSPVKTWLDSDRKLARIAAVGATLLAAPLVLTACASGGSAAGGGGQSPAAHTHATGETVEVHSGPMGKYLTDQNGKTLYMFASDTATKSTCTAACQTYWPLASGPAKAGSGVTASKLGTITNGGKKQATYAGHPLYYYSGDSKAGDMNGQGSTNFGASWWILAPSGKPITSKSTSGGSSSSSPAGSSSSSSAGGGGGGGWA